MKALWNMIGLLCLSACWGGSQKAVVNLKFTRAVESASTLDATSATSPFADNHCYFANVSSEEANACSSGASSRVGETFGPVSKGEVLELIVDSGPTRIDLLAFASPECDDTLEIEEHGDGHFKTFMYGQTYEPVWLVGTTAFDAEPGEQTVEMDVLGTTPTEMGVSLACNEALAPQVSSVYMTDNRTFEIVGNQLDETSRVSLNGLGTALNIISKDANKVVAQLVDSASVVLGQSLDLLVANAYGTTATSLNVTLGNGSIRPEHLDMSLDWPFPTEKSLQFISAISHTGSSTGLSGQGIDIIDGNSATKLTLIPQESSSYSGPCDPSGLNSGGYLVFQIGDGTTLYEGDIKVLVSSNSSNQLQIYSIATHTDAASETLTSSGIVTASTTQTWFNLSFSGRYIALKPSCSYFSSPTEALSMHELRVVAQPVN